ncbi:MAG: calcium-translocating P-type ATPase, PMCA-type [Treponema sp.]|jgi:calcium-translocating P-type ATPase|nr:calcium-translocating P-type ATPase, PMCA-type [Treponema sp.]
MRGLSKQEAIASCEKWGDNRLPEQEKSGFWSVFLGNANDPMIRILCVALLVNIVLAAASAFGWIPENVAWYEPVGIAVAILLATFVSSFSEYNNENAFRRLQEEASRVMCKVWRDGSLVELPIDDIVRGDEILLQTGDKVPADGFVVDGSLKVDQAALNGEAQETAKIPVKEGYVYDEGTVDFLDPFRVFRGAVVVSGSAHMRAAVVGEMSVYGGIAKDLGHEDDRDTPLKVKLGALAKGISVFGYIGGGVIALSLLFQRVVVANQFDLSLIGAYVANWTRLLNDIINAVMLAVIIIVMAVPEGLPLMIAIVSALNMGKMLKDNVLVRKIFGIETAGSLNFLFSDKTGTITKGKLEAIGFYDAQCVEYAEYDTVPPELRRYLGYSLCLNTGAVLSGDGKPAIAGNGTERALLNFASSKDDSASAKVVEQIPFNSTDKFSAAIIETDAENVFEKKTWTLVKGAPEKIIDKCAYYIEKNGAKTALSSIDTINKTVDSLADRAIRVIALALCSEKISPGGEGLDQRFPADAEWILVGIVGIRDDIRPESAGSIAEVLNAGVRVVMITGDRKETAVAIAKEAGLLADPGDIVLSSDELAGLNDDELKKKLPFIKVIARALPADKSRLIRIAQELNFVAGMTGDGVNDSPALKKADVGFAMGGGTEVAKEASEIVILDDNFSSINKAILYGRTIFNSIRKFIVFQLTINVSAVFVTFIAPLLGQDSPLSITQILWINLIMDTLAALAFGGEPALRRYMSEQPKRREESIVSPGMWSAIITGALWTFALSCVYLFTSLLKSYFTADSGVDTFHTGYFALFVFTAVFNAFNARTEKINLFDNMSGNQGFLRVLGIIVVVQVALVYLGGAVFNCWGLSAKQWMAIIALALTIMPIDIVRKFIPAFTREREVKALTQSGVK